MSIVLVESVIANFHQQRKMPQGETMSIKLAESVIANFDQQRKMPQGETMSIHLGGPSLAQNYMGFPRQAGPIRWG